MHSVHFPSSFYPRSAYPGRVVVEGRIGREVVAGLERRGHEVEVIDDWVNGKPMGIQYGGPDGVIAGRFPEGHHRIRVGVVIAVDWTAHSLVRRQTLRGWGGPRGRYGRPSNPSPYALRAVGLNRRGGSRSMSQPDSTAGPS